MRLRGLHVVGALVLWSGIAATQGCGGKVTDVGPGGGSSGTASSSGATGSSGAGTSSGVSSGSGGSSGAPAGCVADASRRCTGHTIGVSCPAGDDPNQNAGLYCGPPTPNPDGTDGYCCDTIGGGTPCQNDPTVTGCAYPSYGFSCTGSDTPEQEDPTLTCSTGLPDPSAGLTLYCCVDNGGGGSSGTSSGGGPSCVVDATLACRPGTDGVDCVAGGNPEADFPGYVCSPPSPQADGSDGYCCATGFAGSTCVQSFSVQGCTYPTIGFSCAGTDTPGEADPSLNCSAGVVDPQTGDVLYCCD
jgi:hypothetical protein